MVRCAEALDRLRRTRTTRNYGKLRKGCWLEGGRGACGVWLCTTTVAHRIPQRHDRYDRKDRYQRKILAAKHALLASGITGKRSSARSR